MKYHLDGANLELLTRLGQEGVINIDVIKAKG